MERTHRAQNFAGYLRDSLERDSPEDWFEAPIEVQVEVEAHDRSTQKLFGIFQRPYVGLRRVDSLRLAFESSHSRLILLGGEPGSGKSVALRRLARELANHAARSRSPTTALPVHIDLKNFHRESRQRLDASAFSNFITDTLTRSKNYNVDNLIGDEYPARLQSNGWIFLFDSFDEIPEILSSPEPDPKSVLLYENMIDEFMQLNNCRAILASRYFHGPNHLTWDRFDLAGLSARERRRLISAYIASSGTRQDVTGQLDTAQGTLGAVSRNPFYIGLIASYFHQRGNFPLSLFEVFDVHVLKRYRDAKVRLHARHGLTPEQVHPTAQRLAFAMSAHPALGLSADRDALKQACNSLQMPLPTDLDAHVRALELLVAASRFALDGPGPRWFSPFGRRACGDSSMHQQDRCGRDTQRLDS